MSGPKYSEAEIERQRQLELEKKRKREIERQKQLLREARDLYKRKIKEFHDVKRKCEQEFSEDRINSIFSGESCEAFCGLEDLDDCKVVDIRDIQTRTEKISEAIKNVNSKIELLHHKVEEKNILDNISKAQIEKSKAVLVGQFVESVDYTDYIEVINNARNSKELLTDDRKLIIKKCDYIEETISEEYEDIKDKIRILDSLKEELSIMIFNAVKKYSRVSDLYTEYVIVVEMVGKEPKSINDFKDENALKNELEALKQELARHDELEYIASAVEEVMNLYGHNIVKSSVLFKSNRTEDRVMNDIYQYDTDSAINVMVSNDGAVMMEIVEIGDDILLTDQDVEKSVEHMKSFCCQYPEIIEQLEKRGVVFKNREELPPHKEYAKKLAIVETETTRSNKRRIQEEQRRTRGRNVKSNYL